MDRHNLVTFLWDLKLELERREYILTATVSGDIYTAEMAYDMQTISQYLDLINVKAFDYHGP